MSTRRGPFTNLASAAETPEIIQIPPIPAVRLDYLDNRIIVWAMRGFGQDVRVAVVDIAGVRPKESSLYPSPYASLISTSVHDAARISIAELPPGAGLGRLL